MSGEVQDGHGFYDPMAEYVEQLGHDKCIAGFTRGCRDPMATPVEKLSEGNDRRIMHDKNRRFKNNPSIILLHITALDQAGKKGLQT